jgi:hypothetical protein
MQPKQPRKKRAGSSSSSKDEVVRGQDEEVEEAEEKGKADVSDQRSCKRPKNLEILAGGETLANSGGTACTTGCGQQTVTVGGRGERGATGMGGGALGGGSSSAQERERLLQNAEDTCSNTPEGGRFRGVFVDSVPLASLNAAAVQGEAALMSVVKTAVKRRNRLSLRRTRGAARGAGGGEGR